MKNILCLSLIVRVIFSTTICVFESDSKNITRSYENNLSISFLLMEIQNTSLKYKKIYLFFDKIETNITKNIYFNIPMVIDFNASIINITNGTIYIDQNIELIILNCKLNYLSENNFGFYLNQFSYLKLQVKIIEKNKINFINFL